VGEVFQTRLTGVQKFGMFATIIGLGGDGLVPVSTLGAERFSYDERAQVLQGDESGTRYAIGDILPLRLAEANPLTGALKFELEDRAGSPIEPRGKRVPPKNQGKHTAGKRGRPGNIRHQGRRR
jgi:ribonuclease R